MTFPPQPIAIDEALLREMFAAQGKSFRGGAVENLGGAPMLKGHGNDSQPFDLETACYLKPVFAEYDQAIANGTRLFLVLKAGVKTVKSFTLEVCAGDHVCNRSGDAAIFFGSENAAETTATTRILDFFKGDDLGGGIPRFRKKMETMRTRFDETMGALKFPDKTLFILSANLSNTQQKNLAFVGLQDAFVTGTSGMIKEMIARTTQYEKECIIFLESQGGEKGFDFDTEYETTDQRELHVECPCCGTSHIFNWKAFDEQHMTRGEDFKAVLEKSVISEKWRAAGLEPARRDCSFAAHVKAVSASLRLRSEEQSARLKNKTAGFQRGPEELIKFENGDYNEAAILRETHFECFHCGGIWRDDGEFGPTRIGLDKSSHYAAARTDALPGNVGFNIPQWINRRLSWGKMMLEKLKEQKKAKETGNFTPIKQWWQKTAARTWDQELFDRKSKLIVPGSYETDPAKRSFGEEFHCRQGTADCGKATDAEAHENRIGTFWFEIRDWAKRGDSKQLARGFVDSWELLFAQYRYWKVPMPRVFIDSAWMPSQVEEAAVKFFELETVGLMQIPRCARLMLGAAAGRRLTINNKGVSFMENKLPGVRTAHDKTGKLWRMSLYKLTWANLWFEQQFESIIGGGVDVKWDILPKEKLVIVDVDGKPSAELLAKSLEREEGKGAKFPSYQDQLDSRYYSDKTRKYEDYAKASRPTEFRDCALMQLVGVAADGLLGHVSVADDAEKN